MIPLGLCNFSAIIFNLPVVDKLNLTGRHKPWSAKAFRCITDLHHVKENLINGVKGFFIFLQADKAQFFYPDNLRVVPVFFLEGFIVLQQFRRIGT